MKKISIIIVLVLTASIALMGFGCLQDIQLDNCKHSVSVFTSNTATCTQGGEGVGVCDICGKTVTVSTPAKGHVRVNGVCTVCDDEDLSCWEMGMPLTADNIDAYCDYYIQNIRADSYVDFAQAYDIDLEKYPELDNVGMFWTYYDEAEKIVREVSMRDKNGVDEMISNGLIDGSKPTIIFIHGVCVDTYEKAYVTGVSGAKVYIPSGGYYANENVLDPKDETLSQYVDCTGLVNLNLIYLKNGYNVINFSYSRFGDESSYISTETSDDGVTRKIVYANNMTIESKIYSTEGPAGMRFRYENGTFSDGSDFSGAYSQTEGGEIKKDIEFTVAEYFVAEYVRMVRYLKEKNVFDNDFNMQICGHSMGGVVVNIGAFLITELARTNVIDSSFIPDRLILEDSYLGVYANYEDSIPSYSDLNDIQKNGLTYYRMLATYGIKCHWTGKVLDGAGTAPTYLAALRALSEDYGVAIEYYMDGNITKYASLTAPKINQLMRKYTVTSTYKFGFSGSYSSHNAARECHCASLAFNKYLDVTDVNTLAYAPSAKLTDAEILALRGNEYLQITGMKTSSLNDDTFILVDVHK